jgi:hypothetical protein
MISRINFFGGPGVGKSTLAAQFFAHLKRRGRSIELVQEFVKQYVYTQRNLSNWGHVYTFGRQFGEELRPLEAGVHQIITDSPLLLQVAYARHHGCPVDDQLAETVAEFEKAWPSINILVKRTVPYTGASRWHTEEEAKTLDEMIEQYLIRSSIPFTYIDHSDSEDVEIHLELMENL